MRVYRFCYFKCFLLRMIIMNFDTNIKVMLQGTTFSYWCLSLNRVLSSHPHSYPCYPYSYFIPTRIIFSAADPHVVSQQNYWTQRLTIPITYFTIVISRI